MYLCLPNINKRLENHGGNLVFFVGSDLVVTTILKNSSTRTFNIKKDAVYLIIARTSNGGRPSYTGANVEVINNGEFSASAGTGYWRFIIMLRALEDGALTLTYSTQFFDNTVYEVAIE